MFCHFCLLYCFSYFQAFSTVGIGRNQMSVQPYKKKRGKSLQILWRNNVHYVHTWASKKEREESKQSVSHISSMQLQIRGNADRCLNWTVPWSLTSFHSFTACAKGIKTKTRNYTTTVSLPKSQPVLRNQKHTMQVADAAYLFSLAGLFLLFPPTYFWHKVCEEGLSLPHLFDALEPVIFTVFWCKVAEGRPVKQDKQTESWSDAGLNS